MVKIDNLSFGSIVIDGKKYKHDVIIYPNGVVKRRKGGFLLFGRHTIKIDGIEELYNSNPEILIVGTGTSGKAKLSEESSNFLKNKGLEVFTASSYEAVKKFNELTGLGKKVGAIFHVTC
ncbi:MAG: Mth938-like domain-containing protein [Candidatus Bathyarchaeota archaeon]